jgi:hypothetical protein
VSANGSGSVVTLDIEKGVRSVTDLVALRRPIEWLQHDSFPLFLKFKALRNVTAPWMLSEGATPPARPARRTISGDLLGTAEKFLRGKS